jgi:hypothetical protein
MTRSRKAVALGCVALIVFAGLFPLGAASLAWLVITPAFVLVPPPPDVVLVRESSKPIEQPVALCSLVDSRGPPALPLS